MKHHETHGKEAHRSAIQNRTRVITLQKTMGIRHDTWIVRTSAHPAAPMMILCTARMHLLLATLEEVKDIIAQGKGWMQLAPITELR